VRVARIGDAERVAQLSGELGYPSSTEDIRQRLRDLDASSDDAVLVADVEGRVAGWVHVGRVLSVEYDALAEVRGIVVDSTARSRGIGAALLHAAEDWAMRAGLREIRVRSQLMRQRAHRFYLERGYEERKRQVVFVKSLR
jgi:GNAT superfamily N-acetyltransferase